MMNVDYSMVVGKATGGHNILNIVYHLDMVKFLKYYLWNPFIYLRTICKASSYNIFLLNTSSETCIAWLSLIQIM